MSQLGSLEAGSRHDLRVGISPDAPDEADFRDEGEGVFGYVHSYESSSRYDGPGLRVVLFLSGCLLRCSYCHNPDTWHLKDGTYVSAQQVIDRLGTFAPALRSLALEWNIFRLHSRAPPSGRGHRCRPPCSILWRLDRQ